MRLAAKIDTTQKEIVDGLRACGYSVQSLAAVGRGVPDLLVASRTSMFLIEVKTGRGKPTDLQRQWAGRWPLPVRVLRSVDDIAHLNTTEVETLC